MYVYFFSFVPLSDSQLVCAVQTFMEAAKRIYEKIQSGDFDVKNEVFLSLSLLSSLCLAPHLFMISSSSDEWNQAWAQQHTNTIQLLPRQCSPFIVMLLTSPCFVQILLSFHSFLWSVCHACVLGSFVVCCISLFLCS